MVVGISSCIGMICSPICYTLALVRLFEVVRPVEAFFKGLCGVFGLVTMPCRWLFRGLLHVSAKAFRWLFSVAARRC